MERKLKAKEVLWPSRLTGTNAIVYVKTERSVYKFTFSKNGVWVSGGRVGSEPVPAVIHGISFFAGLWMDRIMKNSFLEFDGIRTSKIKAVTIEAQRKILDRAIGKWPQERGAPWE